MATYVPTNWKTGDVITATKLNNMETGISGALQTSGGTMTGNITMSGEAELIGNASTSTSNLVIRETASDFNDIVDPGTYYVNTSITNQPFASNKFVIVLRVNSTAATMVQIVIPSTGREKSIYIRTGNAINKTFGDWGRIPYQF